MVYDDDPRRRTYMPIWSRNRAGRPKSYTVQIEAGSRSNIGPYEQPTVWQAVTGAETVLNGNGEFVSAQDLADSVSAGQNVVDGLWRVLVWEGAGADTSTDPAAVAYSDD